MLRNQSRVNWRFVPSFVLLVATTALLSQEPTPVARPARQMEHLGRGAVALRQADGSVAISWRLLGTDPAEISFAVYRKIDDGPWAKLPGDKPDGPTFFLDRDVSFDHNPHYQIRPTIDGVEQSPCEVLIVPSNDSQSPCLTVPLQTLPGYHPNDASVGDLDGDGEYEIVLHQVGRGRDNSQSGPTTEPILEAYRLDGTMLWRINLGENIREGAHYTQFMVYDLDGDGRAEVACKTADGTIDGQGTVIGDPSADHRNKNGYILTGPEFLTIFDGLTGAAISTVDYLPPRGDVKSWGDDYGNRVDRFLACVAYLDGQRPSLVMCRGYYTRTVLAAWNFRDGNLEHVWTFDSDAGDRKNRAFRGQGNHSVAVGDVDDDGRDEIVYGSCVIDDDGTGLYSTSLKHGDALHLADIDPSRPGLEIFKANGDRQSPAGIALTAARTGEQLFGRASTGNGGVPRACALDIDPRHLGLEMWGKGDGVAGLYTAQGNQISRNSPRTCNMGIWWDGDLTRELLDGVRITKWNVATEREMPLFDGRDFDCVSNNGSKANPCLCADILGDWREELIAASRDGSQLKVFISPLPTEHRLVTLMHDPVYRLGIAWQNVGYNQPAHPGFFVGEGMTEPAPRARISTPPFVP